MHKNPRFVLQGKRDNPFYKWTSSEDSSLSPLINFLCWELHTSEKVASIKTVVDLWWRGNCDWTRPFFPSVLGAAAVLRFMTRMTQLITLGYWRELDVDQALEMFVFIKKKASRSPVAWICQWSKLIFIKSSRPSSALMDRHVASSFSESITKTYEKKGVRE